VDRFLVSADAPNYRRAGRRWQTDPVEIAEDELTPGQWDRLRADRAITVEPAPEARELPVDPVEVDAADYEKALARITELEGALASAGNTIAELQARVAELESTEPTSTREEEVDPPAGAGSPDPAPAGEHRPTRAERIRGAVARSLEADGPEHRTGTGRPVLARVREISGLEDVTASERDAAWADVRGGQTGG